MNINYHTLETASINVTESNESSSLLSHENHNHKKTAAFLLWIFVFLTSFIFYGYCIIHTFEPSGYIFNNINHRNLSEIEEGGCAEFVLPTATAGAIIGIIALALSFISIGSTPTIWFISIGLIQIFAGGPITGGLFATNMCAGLGTGYFMAIIQSAAMTGTAYGTAAAIGATAGSGVALNSFC